MKGGRPTALIVAVCCALLLVPVAPALADDPTPAPTVSVSPTAPAPAPTTPPVSPPTTVPTSPPVTPDSIAELPRRTLPLKKGHFGHLVDLANERLEWMGYSISKGSMKNQSFGESTTKAVKAFQAKFWMTPTGTINKKTWKALSKMASPVGVLPLKCTEVKVALCADKTARLIRYVVKGKVKLTLDARFGLPGMDTGDGVFSVNRKSRDHVSSLYRTWMPFAMFFNGGEAVHYSPFFANEGYNGGSHGCIGTRDIKQAEWLFDRVPMGARVYVYYS
jgi:hypothetical protein